MLLNDPRLLIYIILLVCDGIPFHAAPSIYPTLDSLLGVLKDKNLFQDGRTTL